MDSISVIFYVLFFVSLFAPFYTYFLYPLILMLIPSKKYASSHDYKPSVSVIITANSEEKLTLEKENSIHNLKYPSGKNEVLVCRGGIVNDVDAGITILNISPRSRAEAISALLKAASGTILVITDNKTLIDENSIDYLSRYFYDHRVGCVVGQLRSKKPSVFWKYENFVKINEGRIGLVSGANKVLYAICKDAFDDIPSNIINEDFYISTMVLQNGYDVLFEPNAIAYEKNGEHADHVRDGGGYYQALKVFWRFLLPRKGCFIYWSHRVMKWLVPFNLIFLLLTSGILSIIDYHMVVIFILQILIYAAILIHCTRIKDKQVENENIFVKLLSVGSYFMQLNIDWLSGFLKKHES